MNLTRISQPFSSFLLTAYFMLVSNISIEAATITVPSILGGTVDGLPVNAKADFITSTNSISVTLGNLQENPSGVKQVITGIFFELSTGQTAATLDSISGQQRTINSNGTFSDGGIGTTGWVVTTQGNFILLDILNNPGQPKYGVIGPESSITSKYDNAGGSIAGNNPHNPFFNQVVEFELTVPGVTNATTIPSVYFQFNTVAGSNVSGVPVPEPSGILLVVSLFTVCLLQQKLRKEKY